MPQPMDAETFEITLPSELRQAKLLIQTAMVGVAGDSHTGRSLADAAARIGRLAEEAETYFREIRERRWKSRVAAAASRIRSIGRPRRRGRR